MESRAEMSCVFKVNMNCETCKRKVLDVLQNLHGVYSVAIDAERGTVKVSGKVNPYIILKVFEKYGKHGEVSCIKFDGEVREPFYYHHNCYGGNGYIIPYGSAPPHPLMGRPNYCYPWYDRPRYGSTGPFLPMALPPRPRPPPPPPLYQQPLRPPPPPSARTPPLTQKSPQPPPAAKTKPKPKIRYFPPKAPPVVAPPTEMKPEWCKIM